MTRAHATTPDNHAAAGWLVEPAPAKINLALHVRARMADGYHRIETIFAFARDGDMLAARPDADLQLAIDGPFAAGLDAGADNLVLRAAEALRAATGIRAGAALRLTKALPIAAGIGGGSSDAAAALRLLARMWGVEADLDAIARTLGADVPACLHNRAVMGTGRGEELVPLAGAERLTGMPLLLVNPGVAMPTGPVFRGWDGQDRGPLTIGNDPLAAARAGRNDLAPPAMALAPVIARLVGWLAARPGAVLARMSGSGATCFALFEQVDARDAAADAIARDWPDAWRMATSLA
ncbi:4-(cytidine 5'-diphospho)-2-C-methyl-D-erythritol kinase [Sphingomonas changnyeongensis]|uniref:4-diphosphocytidyl-2-C-methyl-D-erythritol kinase n=1 Tax=Sphingomonas changnyeongensis TaxID=2698679 RepID=A0A7Z2S8M8_9SPHN|nr:4-(cytidine 5'-diphospho)-2-C-methyl-D-erythritol kinase [Sphingomonas changnyeongensis]QHL90807.1 4-(cytidine 5'-diphospho)-2-C-methyl-D-erythritol kinase [Sphingomonas changnyeongensis]